MAEKFVQGKPVTRDMKFLKKHPSFRDIEKAGKGQLTDYSGNHKVTVEWHLNEFADQDKIFKLVIDDKVVYLDLEELTYYTRMMFE